MNKPISDLKINKFNKEIYGDEKLPQSFLDSISEKGVMVPLIIKKDGTIISGHRRYKAAKQLDIKEVPIGIASFDNKLDEKEAIIDFNRQRDKTFSQKMREAETLEAIERKRAEKRMKDGKKIEDDPSKKFYKGSKGRTTDKVAEQVGIGSGQTYDKAKKIWNDAKSGDEQAEKLLSDIDSGKKSISGAYKKIKKKEKQEELEQKKEEIKEQEKNEINYTPVAYHQNYKNYLIDTDQKFDLLLTDPPYSTDINNINEFVNTWIPLALSVLKDNARGFICIGAYPKEMEAYLHFFNNQDRFIIDSPLIWTYKNTLGRTPKMKYNLNYQLILHFYTKQSIDLDTSVTNEMFSVQDINAPDGRQADRFHKWQKPNKLAQRLIRHATKEDDKIIDPFCGSGSFLVNAGKLNRHAEGCDTDKKALKIAKERGCNVKI